MCQMCEDFREFEASFDAYVQRELPKMMAQPIDVELIMGASAQDWCCR